MSDFEPKQFGKYFLIEKLAVGGMAEIYKAKTFGVDGFEKELAIKRILPHCAADKDFITMLVAEAKLSVMLSHANIVQVYDLGKVGDDYFISMEFIHGVNLRDIMYNAREAKVPIPLDISVYIISEICKGLDYAHRKTDQNNNPLDIVHRDVSPQNVLLSYEGEVKIVDFGIAKAAMNISHTMAGILKGKIAYMSPEQATGQTVDNRTDIFSTGILLYEIVTGTKLFTGESQFEVLKKIRSSNVTAENLPDSVPAALKPVLARALAHDVDKRYQNAGDFQIDLTKFLYSTYVDFSPRKLAAFIREVFAEAIRGDQISGARGAAAEQQTSSMDLKEGAKQVEIVHGSEAQAAGEETSKSVVPDEAFRDTMVTPASGTGRKPSPPKSPPPPRATAKKRGFPRFIAAAIVIAALGFLGVRYAPLLMKGSVPPDEGAAEQKPAKPPTAAEEAPKEPVSVGVISVISEPMGAAILVDGRVKDKPTPASIEELPLGKEIRVTVSKPGYQDFERVLVLSSAEPQRIVAKLEPVAPALPPPALPPQTGTQEPLQPVGPPALPPTVPAIPQQQPQTGLPPVATLPTETAKPPAPPTTPPTTPAVEEPPAEPAAKAPDEAPKPQVAEKGELSVTSDPSGARVTVDGRQAGKTPARIPDLSVGKTYSVRLDLEGYKSVTRKKAIKGGKETLYAALTKEEIAPPEPATPPPSKPPAEPAQPPAEAVKGGTGSVKVSSNPSGADLFVNGDFKGKTPMTVSVPSGSVSVLVSKDGMKSSRTVTVKPGQTVSVSDLNLSSSAGEVVIKTDPPRASVVFNGQAIPAPTPVTIRKVPKDRQHSFTVTLEGYRPESRSFNMNEDTKTFSIKLEPR